MSLYLVTGGAGFIGSNIVEELLKQNARVRVLDNLSTGKRENLEIFKGKVEFLELDICNLSDLKDAMKGVQFVFHQAAIPSVPRSIVGPDRVPQCRSYGYFTCSLGCQASGSETSHLCGLVLCLWR